MAGGAFNEAKGLSEQMVFEYLFEAVQRCSGGERVPEVGGCDTEGSVSRGLHFGVGDGDRGLQPSERRVGVEEVS